MDRQQADRVIAELGAKLGCPNLTLDDSGTCTLAIDGDALAVSFRHDSAAGALDLMTGLDDVIVSPARLSRALAANFCWRPADGSTFGLDPVSNRLVLQRRCGGSLDADAAMQVLESLVRHGLAWTRILNDIAIEDPEEPTPLRSTAGLRA